MLSRALTSNGLQNNAQYLLILADALRSRVPAVYVFNEFLG